MNTLSRENFAEATKRTISKLKRKWIFFNNVELVTFHVNTSPDYNKRGLNTYIEFGTKIIVPYPYFSYAINK